jgi:carbamoyl-phosphate synthase large subunit
MTSGDAATVAVTGMGALIGQGIVKSLRNSSHAVRIVGVDRSADSPGPYLVDAFEQKPEVPEDDSGYLDYWARIVRAHDIRLILPGLELDVQFFDRHRSFFQQLGTTVVLNDARLIAQTADKWTFGQALAAIGYPAIPAVRPDTWSEAVAALGPAPLLLKPLQSNGSRGIVHLQDEGDFEYWRRKTAVPWMLQRIVGSADTEYTVGVFGLGDGNFLGPIIFRRRLSSAGNTLMAQTVSTHPVLESAVATLCRHFRPLGPTNLQFRVEGDTAYLLEINPRFSSSNSLRTAFGFNEAEMAVTWYLHGNVPTLPRMMAGTAWRYTEDFVLHAGDRL